MTLAIMITGIVYGLNALVFHAIGVVTTDPRVRNRPLSILASVFFSMILLPRGNPVKEKIDPGKITKVPPVRKVNEFNMAQTNFYYQRDESWVAFTERQLQFLDACRRLFIIDATPGALSPRVTTIVDINRG